MILTMQKADAHGFIRVEDCVQTLYLGVSNFEPYLLYLAAEEGEKGAIVEMFVKKLGDKVSAEDMLDYTVTVISGSEGSCLFFTQKPKIQMGGGPALPPGMSLPGRSFPQ